MRQFLDDHSKFFFLTTLLKKTLIIKSYQRDNMVLKRDYILLPEGC